MLIKLDWDSTHFGYPVYSIYCKEIELEVQKVLNQLLETKFQVCYVESDYYEESFYQKLKVYYPKSIFISQRIVFEVKVQNKNSPFLRLSYTQKKIFKDKIIDLCYQSGDHSRFNVDKNFKNGEFSILYQEWALRSIYSFEKEIISVLDQEKSELLGMAIVSKDFDTLNIEIIAVDLNYRHLGIGSQLINMIHTYAFENNINQIHVVTQFENHNAYNFYNKNMFEVIKTSFQFHVWNK